MFVLFVLAVLTLLSCGVWAIEGATASQTPAGACAPGRAMAAAGSEPTNAPAGSEDAS